MMHPTDVEMIRQMTGLPVVPEKLETEYMAWLGLKHLAGQSGALGVGLLVPLLRQHGYHPRHVKQEAPQGLKQDWSRVTRGTIVEYDTDDGVIQGEYRGIVSTGHLGIQLNGKVEEINMNRCRVATDLAGDCIDAASMRPNPVTIEDTTRTLTPAERDEIEKQNKTPDWTVAEEELPVVVTGYKDGKDATGKFLEYHADEGVITVLLDGKGPQKNRTVDVPADTVTVT